MAIFSAVSMGRGAIHSVQPSHRQPFGEWLLALVAVGLITFALFSFMEARYRRL